MERKDLDKIIKNCLLNNGFEKDNNNFYRKSEEFLCKINVQKSNYDEYIYINVNFFIGNFEKPYTIERDIWDSRGPWLTSRFLINEVDKDRLAYKKYNSDEVQEIIEKNIKFLIIPPFNMGKKYLLDNFQINYFSVFNDEAVKKVLST